jgi:uncharacterized protein (TIGR04255 family)
MLGATGPSDTEDDGSGELPKYHRPPVAELVLSVAFEPLSPLNSFQFFKLWTERFQAFPRIEEQLPYDPQVERFGRAHLLPSMRLALGQPMGRYWFVNDDDTGLIQIQRDWFARNWRRTREEVIYPSFEHVHAQFRDNLSQLIDFIDTAGLGEFLPTQCEVTYVNHIDRRGAWESHGDASKVFSVLSEHQDARFLPKAEDELFGIRYVIPSATGEPIGRLQVQCQPAYRDADQTDPIFVLNVTARGAPLSVDVDGVHAFLRIGHEWIVRGFTEMTTTAMHKAWERYV